jgi:hypothetical protein
MAFPDGWAGYDTITLPNPASFNNRELITPPRGLKWEPCPNGWRLTPETPAPDPNREAE